MKGIREIKKDLYWVGASDRRLELFENLFPIPRGVSYNAYILVDEKTALFDTVDRAVSAEFLSKVEAALNGRALDYVIVNHMEPDHCAVLQTLVSRYPDVKVVCNSKTVVMIKQFFDFDIDSRSVLVKEGSMLDLGKHVLQFFTAPMVHWPEVMVTYDRTDKVLFSADAFGAFGAIDGNLFDDTIDFESDWLDDVRRYYTNIVGKYGAQVQALLKKTAPLAIETICPLHGEIWRSNIDFILDKYNRWSSYTPEQNGVLVAYASMYGNTQTAAELVATTLAEEGVHSLAVCDVSKTHVSQLIAQAFRFSHMVLLSPTYNGGIFPLMDQFLEDMKRLGLRARTVALVDNGSWAPMAAKQMAKKLIEEMKDMTVMEQSVSIHGGIKPETEIALCELGRAVAASVQEKDRT